jgi:hypothetical protein
LFQYPNYIPVVCHNLRGYDSHLIIRQIGKYINENDKKSKLTCIPNNSEKFMSFSWDNIRFIDSLNFMNSSLDKLASYLPDNLKVHTKNNILGLNNEKFSLLIKKGIFPYDWFDDVSKINESSLPSKDKFYSALKNEHITDEEYTHAINVWNTFNCKTFKDYLELYSRTDVLLLSDVFENFRSTCIQYYKLDPSHYYSLPGFSWDALLSYSKVELELFTEDDYDMYLFCERAKRGGICVISHKYAKANNKYLPDYKKSEKSYYIMYLDANNLYGWAMSQKLPFRKFKWVDINDFDLNKIDVDGEKGYYIEVDLDYPEHLHDIDNDYPMAPEKVKIKYEMLSNYSKGLFDSLGLKNDTMEKLVPNLNNKRNYVCHIKNLKFYLSRGMILKKIHKVLEFEQQAWMKSYIDFNTTKRSKAANDFEKDLFKLMNNAVFGKTMENVRERVNIELVTNKKRAEKIISHPTYKSHSIIDEDLVAFSRTKEIVKLNKPIYCGLAVLDLSKLVMYDFHYNYMIKNYGYEKVKLLMTDTDSFVYRVETDDIYEDMKSNKQLFDLSDYNKTHFLYDATNKKVIGKFKDETNGMPISEFVGLRSKMYAFTVDNKEKKKAKGINNSVVQKTVNFDQYKNSLFGAEKKDIQQMCSMKSIRSINHNVYTIEVNKIGLSSFDNKRYVLDDKVSTLAYGHYEIKN